MPTMKEKLDVIESARQMRNVGGGLAEIEKQHEKGRLTARERIEKLIDKGTFQEIDPWSDAYKTGFPIDDMDIYGDQILDMIF